MQAGQLLPWQTVQHIISAPVSAALQMHCTENSKQIFPERKLRGLVPNFYIHISVSDLYFTTIGLQTQDRKIGGPMWEYINCSQIHECRNWERDCAVSFQGIVVSNFRCSVARLSTNFFRYNSLVFSFSREGVTDCLI